MCENEAIVCIFMMLPYLGGRWQFIIKKCIFLTDLKFQYSYNTLYYFLTNAIFFPLNIINHKD